MIHAHNIVSGKHNNQSTLKLNLSQVSNARGNIYKMQLTHMHYNLLEHFLLIEWLQYGIVYLTLLFLQSTNTFNHCIDKFWANRDFKFDWIADITGIGSRIINSSSYV